jgi:hypothetical protein
MMMTSAAVSAGSSIAGGMAAKRAADAQAAGLDRQAAQELDLGEQQASKVRRAGAQARGSAVASLAASGVRVGEGSALEVERYVMQGSEEDAGMALLNATRRAGELRSQAELTRKAGRNARLQGFVQGAGSLLSAGSQMGGWNALRGWDARGFTGTNDRSMASIGSQSDWFVRYGRGGD